MSYSGSSDGALKLSLFGANIQKTRLPKLLRLLCAREGLTLAFDLSDSAGDKSFDFRARAKACAAAGYTGIVVTHPFKTLAPGLAGERRGVPSGLGAANCLRFDVGSWVATNTDFTGLKKAWMAEMGAAKPGRVAMAGAGGVARSIAFALRDLGAERIDIFDTQPKRAQAVASDCDPSGAVVRALDAETFRAAARAASGLVNATPLGMDQYPGMAFNDHDIGPQQWVFDAVYTPIETPFMQAALRQGLKRLTGFHLFLHMGLDTFTFFTGREVDRTAVMPDLRELAPRN